MIGRWNVIDPLAEDYVDVSPYNYVANDPANNTDPDGRSIVGREGFFNDYHYGPNGSLNFVVIKPGDDRFFQTDKNGNIIELQGNQLTPSMSAQYLFAASKLAPNDGVQLNEVEIKGQTFKAYTIAPYVPRSISLVGEAGLEMSYPIEGLFPALRTFQSIFSIFLLSKDGHFNQAHKYSGLTGSQIIAKFRAAKVRKVFPEQYNDTVWEVIVKEANRGVKAAQTARKLLTDARFNKL